jgi:hypothetical protein
MTFRRIKNSAASVLALFLVIVFSVLDKVEGKTDAKTAILDEIRQRLVVGFVACAFRHFSARLVILTLKSE